MNIQVQKVRAYFWQARINQRTSCSNKVGSGRSKAEAIGNLIMQLAEEQFIHGSPQITELPPGQFSNLPAGR